jgi:hypothetical protein
MNARAARLPEKESGGVLRAWTLCDSALLRMAVVGSTNLARIQGGSCMARCTASQIVEAQTWSEAVPTRDVRSAAWTERMVAKTRARKAHTWWFWYK